MAEIIHMLNTKISLNELNNIDKSYDISQIIKQSKFNKADFKEWIGEWHERVSLSVPEGITVDKAGNIYVADTLNNRIQKFSK